MVNYPNHGFSRSVFILLWITSCFLLVRHQVNGRCSSGGKLYVIGQVWFPNGSSQCKQCRCDQGDHIVCRTVCKAGRFPPDILIQDGLTSDSIENDANQAWKRPCLLEGKTYRDGVTWRETGPHSRRLKANECMECNCASQVVTCAIRTCPKTFCANPVHHEGTCCKLCPEKPVFRPPRDSGRKGCTSIGRHFKDGYRWQLYLPSKNVFTACFSCSCQDGKESCRKHVCPQPSCSRPVRKPGSCCASCKDEEMSIQGKVQENDNSTAGFRPIPILTERTMHAVTNTRPATTDVARAIGRDRSRRKKGARDCEFGRNQVYKHNESFHPILEPFGRQKCTKCLCSNKMIKCGRIRCPNTYPCRNPQTRPNLCCKVCPGTKDQDAHHLEKIQMYRTKGCARVRKSHIQVYKYSSRGFDRSTFTQKYLFDRSFLHNSKSSEMHIINVRHNNINIVREIVAKADVRTVLLDAKWEYTGSIKERVYMRFLMGEAELESCSLGPSCLSKLDQVRQHLESRASKRRQCRSSSVIQSLQRLQEAG